MRARPSPIPAPAEPTVSVCAGGRARTSPRAGLQPGGRCLDARNRARTADTVTVEEADEVGRRDVLDLVDDESAEGIDVLPARTPRRRGPRASEPPAAERPRPRGRRARRRRRPKLKQGVALIKQLVADGYNPIVFCRFIPTAHYLADALRSKLRGVESRR